MFYKTKSGCRFGKKCTFAHRQVDEQPTKRSKKNDDKSAVAILKKGDWQERGPVTDQCHDRRVKLDKRSDKKLGQKSSKRQSSDARQLGCVFQDMTPPKSFLQKCTDMRKPIQRVKFTKLLHAFWRVPFFKISYCKFLQSNPCKAIGTFYHWDSFLWDFGSSMVFAHSAA